MDKIALSFK